MNMLIILTFSSLFWLGMWQLDHFVSRYIWVLKGQRLEIMTFPILGTVYMEFTNFYCLCFLALTLGWLGTAAWFVL